MPRGLFGGENLCPGVGGYTHNHHGVTSLDKYAHGIKKKKQKTKQLHLHNAIRFISGGRNMRQPLRNSKELFLSPLPHLVIFFGFLLNYIASALRLLIDLGF